MQITWLHVLTNIVKIQSQQWGCTIHAYRSSLLSPCLRFLTVILKKQSFHLEKTKSPFWESKTSQIQPKSPSKKANLPFEKANSTTSTKIPLSRNSLMRKQTSPSWYRNRNIPLDTGIKISLLWQTSPFWECKISLLELEKPDNYQIVILWILKLTNYSKST